MAKDQEVPSVLGALHYKYATPHTAVWLITIISAIIGGIGVISVTNLTAVTLVSNIGTFILYGMTNLISLVAFKHSIKKKLLAHIIIPILGFLANISMLLAVLYLGILGGGATQTAAIAAIIATIIWLLLGVVYLVFNSKRQEKTIILKQKY